MGVLTNIAEKLGNVIGEASKLLLSPEELVRLRQNVEAKLAISGFKDESVAAYEKSGGDPEYLKNRAIKLKARSLRNRGVGHFEALRLAENEVNANKGPSAAAIPNVDPIVEKQNITNNLLQNLTNETKKTHETVKKTVKDKDRESVTLLATVKGMLGRLGSVAAGVTGNVARKAAVGTGIGLLGGFLNEDNVDEEGKPKNAYSHLYKTLIPEEQRKKIDEFRNSGIKNFFGNKEAGDESGQKGYKENLLPALNMGVGVMQAMNLAGIDSTVVIVPAVIALTAAIIALSPIISGVKTAFDAIKETIKDVFTKIGDTLKEISQSLHEIVGSVNKFLAFFGIKEKPTIVQQKQDAGVESLVQEFKKDPVRGKQIAEDLGKKPDELTTEDYKNWVKKNIKQEDLVNSGERALNNAIPLIEDVLKNKQVSADPVPGRPITENYLPTPSVDEMYFNALHGIKTNNSPAPTNAPNLVNSSQVGPSTDSMAIGIIPNKDLDLSHMPARNRKGYEKLLRESSGASSITIINNNIAPTPAKQMPNIPGDPPQRPEVGVSSAVPQINRMFDAITGYGQRLSPI